MRIINGCGYNLSGCTAITDFFSDYQGAGYLNHDKHEIGILKCRYGFAGSIQALLRGESFSATKAQLRASLLGDALALESANLGPVEKLHLEMRLRVAGQLGADYKPLVDKVMQLIPEQQATLASYEEALALWFEGVLQLIPDKHFLDGCQSSSSFVILKNDPPGKYPFMASLIPNGVSFSSLRNPIDACFDFNRFYKKGMAETQIKNYCDMFNSIVRTAIHHIDLYEQKIFEKFYVVRFEDFIQKSDVRKQVIEKAGISQEKRRHSFNPDVSKDNIGIGNELPAKMLNLIKESSMPWYEKYQDFLAQRQFLIE